MNPVCQDRSDQSLYFRDGILYEFSNVEIRNTHEDCIAVVEGD